MITTVVWGSPSLGRCPRLRAGRSEAGPRRVPSPITQSPTAILAAVAHMLADAAAADTLTSSRPPSVPSTGTTASAPSGIGAPVMMRILCPGAKLSVSVFPAAMSRTTGRVTGLCRAGRDQICASNGIPVHDEVPEARKGTWLVTFCARTHPCASSSRDQPAAAAARSPTIRQRWLLTVITDLKIPCREVPLCYEMQATKRSRSRASGGSTARRTTRLQIVQTGRRCRSDGHGRSHRARLLQALTTRRTAAVRRSAGSRCRDRAGSWPESQISTGPGCSAR